LHTADREPLGDVLVLQVICSQQHDVRTLRQSHERQDERLHASLAAD
jgi:hypothetical protein